MDALMSLTTRVLRARERMDELGVDVLLLSVGADLPYLTGYEAMPLERLTMLVLPRVGDARLGVPPLGAAPAGAPPRPFCAAPRRSPASSRAFRGRKRTTRSSSLPSCWAAVRCAPRSATRHGPGSSWT